jgi:hypothetical protein
MLFVIASSRLVSGVICCHDGRCTPDAAAESRRLGRFTAGIWFLTAATMGPATAPTLTVGTGEGKVSFWHELVLQRRDRVPRRLRRRWTA